MCLCYDLKSGRARWWTFNLNLHGRLSSIWLFPFPTRIGKTIPKIGKHAPLYANFHLSRPISKSSYLARYLAIGKFIRITYVSSNVSCEKASQIKDERIFISVLKCRHPAFGTGYTANSRNFSHDFSFDSSRHFKSVSEWCLAKYIKYSTCPRPLPCHLACL